MSSLRRKINVVKKKRGEPITQKILRWLIEREDSGGYGRDGGLPETIERIGGVIVFAGADSSLDWMPISEAIFAYERALKRWESRPSDIMDQDFCSLDEFFFDEMNERRESPSLKEIASLIGQGDSDYHDLPYTGESMYLDFVDAIGSEAVVIVCRRDSESAPDITVLSAYEAVSLYIEAEKIWKRAQAAPEEDDMEYASFADVVYRNSH